MTDNKDIVNRRIVCNESFGVIKYVGILEGTGQEVWYGVEWDDPTRGKHDGLYKGKRYFQTKHPTSGSFVKPNKVEFGVDIFEATKEKYLSNNDTTDNKDKKRDENEDEYLYDASRLIERLTCVSLAYCKINSVDSIDSFIKTFKNINEIDLESNLFHSWSQIFKILDNLKYVRILNISNNRLEFPNDNNNEVKDCFYGNINYLVLNRMDYTWSDVLRIIKYFPGLNQLKVCFNSITKIDEINENLSNNLKILDLESNDINDWENLLKLGELKELEHLYVNNIGVSKIFFKDVELNNTTKLFPKLKSIALNQNKIDNWHSINELNKLASFEEIRFMGNPLNDTDRVTNIREAFIAKIKKLKILNRTRIVNNERLGAELDYMKKFFKEYLAIKDSPTLDSYKEFHLNHPRYLEFIERFGMPELCEVNVQPETVKSSLISINIVNDVTKEKLVRKIPLSMTVQRLKGVIAKLYAKSGFDKDSINLIYVSEKQLGDNYELDNEFRDLKFYSVEDGDTIIAKLIA